MIAWLEGTLREKTPARCILVCGGVGYGLSVPASTFARLPSEGEGAALHVHTHVREGAIDLFGFSTTAELQTFDLLLQVSGVGPRLALKILSGASPQELLGAIASGDEARLSAAPGVGKKTAEKIVFTLREKIPAGAELPQGAGGVMADLVSALTNLGYKRALAERAAHRVVREQGEDAGFEILVRQALKGLGR